MKVEVIGAGPWEHAYNTPANEELLRSSDAVLTSARLLPYALSLNPESRAMSVTDTVRYIAENSKADSTISVLASGDTGLFSIAGTIRRRLAETENVEVSFHPGISSLSYLAARARLQYEKALIFSLHGAGAAEDAVRIVPLCCYNESVFALTGGQVKAQDILRTLLSHGLSDVRVFVGENLGSPAERLVEGTAAELKDEVFGDLAAVAVENSHPARHGYIPEDADFEREKGVPLSKKGVRTLALAQLAIEPEDIVYDIGSGTGGMTCTLALAASRGMVYAVETAEDALALTRRNVEKLGTRNVIVQAGSAPDVLEGLPQPDKAFIGGSRGNLSSIIDLLLEKNPSVRIVLTAVTLETLAEALGIAKERKLHTEVLLANIATAAASGKYHLMKAENPIYILTMGGSDAEK